MKVSWSSILQLVFWLLGKVAQDENKNQIPDFMEKNHVPEKNVEKEKP